MNPLSISDAFGIHTIDYWSEKIRTSAGGEFSGEDKSELSNFNIGLICANIAGYIPIISTIVGIARHILCYYALSFPERESFIDPFIRGHQIRGTVEFLSIGILNLPFDLYFSIEGF